jgi:hypothetical protein
LFALAGVCGLLLIAIAAVVVYGATNRSASTTTGSGPSVATTSTSRGGATVTDGPMIFSVERVDNHDTVISTSTAQVQKATNGEFFVVYLRVVNEGNSPVTFFSTAQRLLTGGQTFYHADHEASLALGGGVVTIKPQDTVKVAAAFDVPVGTAPRAIELHGVLFGKGVELPL